MTTPSTPASTPPASAAAQSSGIETNFSERLKFEPLYDGLAEKGIQLSEAEKKRLEQITREELNRYDNSVFSAMGPSNVLYLLFAFIGNLLSGKGTTDFSNLSDHLSATNDKAVEMSKLRQLQGASSNIYFRLKNAGGNLAAAAEYATGASQTGAAPQDMDGSIYGQLREGIKLEYGTSSKLSSLDPRVQTDLPNAKSTQGLTR